MCSLIIKSIKLRFWVILALLHDTQIQTSCVPLWHVRVHKASTMSLVRIRRRTLHIFDLNSFAGCDVRDGSRLSWFQGLLHDSEQFFVFHFLGRNLPTHPTINTAMQNSWSAWKFIVSQSRGIHYTRGCALWWPIQGGSTRNGYLFQTSGIWKGWDFSSWSI